MIIFLANGHAVHYSDDALSLSESISQQHFSPEVFFKFRFELKMFFLYICLFVCLYICQNQSASSTSAQRYFFKVDLNLNFFLYICLFVYLFVYLFVCLYICLNQSASSTSAQRYFSKFTRI